MLNNSNSTRDSVQNIILFFVDVIGVLIAYYASGIIWLMVYRHMNVNSTVVQLSTNLDTIIVAALISMLFVNEKGDCLKRGRFEELRTVICKVAVFAAMAAVYELVTRRSQIPRGVYICTVFISLVFIYTGRELIKRYLKSLGKNEEKAARVIAITMKDRAAHLDEVIYSTNVENLDVILAGPVPPNPAELLDSPLYKETVKEMREKYDYVIIDTPPLGSVIDAAIVATVSDGAVLVIAANQVSYKFAQNVMDQLRKTKVKIIGSVLNKVDLSENGYYGKYYGKYYGSYYGNYHSDESPDKSFEKAKAETAKKNTASKSVTTASAKNTIKPAAGSVGSVASRKNAHSQNQVMAAKNKAASANKAGSVNGVPLKKRNGRTEEYEGDFLLDMDFDDDNK